MGLAKYFIYSMFSWSWWFALHYASRGDSWTRFIKSWVYGRDIIILWYWGFLDQDVPQSVSLIFCALQNCLPIFNWQKCVYLSTHHNYHRIIAQLIWAMRFLALEGSLQWRQWLIIFLTAVLYLLLSVTFYLHLVGGPMVQKYFIFSKGPLYIGCTNNDGLQHCRIWLWWCLILFYVFVWVRLRK